MQRTIIPLVLLVVLATGTQVSAITPGSDLIIPGAARTALWVDDLYVNNPNGTTVAVEVSWLERGQANPNPVTRTYDIAPGATLILHDVILGDFGLERGNGAFRITSTGGNVVANLIAVAVIDDEHGTRTLGSGFEAIPASAATSAGQSATLMGIVATDDFRTNLFATAGPQGVTMELDLLDPWGPVIDSVTVALDAYEPWFSGVTRLWGIDTLLNGTARVRVTAGSVVILGSKIDNHRMSQDPTTLEASFGSASASPDGTYHFALYDSLSFASGGNIVISGGIVETLTGTYINFDKLDDQGEPECPLIFMWGDALDPAPISDFADGVVFTDSYPDGGEMSWTVTIAIDANLGFSGTVEALGSGFTGIDENCNGIFPTLEFEGGKDE